MTGEHMFTVKIKAAESHSVYNSDFVVLTAFSLLTLIVTQISE